MSDSVILLLTVVSSVTIIFLGAAIIRIFERPVFGIGLLVFFLPFERIPTLQIAGVTLRINHVVAGLILLAISVQLLLGRLRLRREPLGPLLLVFVASLFVALPGAHNLGHAVTVTIFTLFTITVAWLVVTLVTSRDQLKILVKILGITALLTALFGFFQFVGDMAGLPTALTGLDPGFTKAVFGFPRIHAFSLEPLFYGNFLLVPIGLALAFWLVPQSWFRRPATGSLLLILGLALGLTLSRGAILGCIALVLVVGFFLLRCVLSARTIATVLVGAVLIITAISATLAVVSPDAGRAFLDHLVIRDFGQSESTAGRLAGWSQAFDLWRDHPVVGVGPGNYGPAILGYPAAPVGRGWPVVNNEYVEILAETGSVGLTAFLLFLAGLLLRSLRAYAATRADPELRAVIIGLTAAVVGMLVQYNFFSTLYIVPVWIAFGLLMAAQNIALAEHSKTKEAR